MNDFNESFKQFVAVEKAFEDLKLKDTERSTTKVLQNVDTQTSVIAKTYNTNDGSSSRHSISTINFSRGSEISEEETIESVQNIDNNKSSRNSLHNSSFDWNLHDVDDSATTMLSLAEEERSKISMSNVENCSNKECAGVLSLNIVSKYI